MSRVALLLIGLCCFFACGGCLFGDSTCFAALQANLVNRVTATCIDDMTGDRCTDELNQALFELAPTNADQVYSELLPTFRQPDYLLPQTAELSTGVSGLFASLDQRDVLFFKEVFALFEGRDRAAQVPLQNVSLGLSQLFAMPALRDYNCSGIDWLARKYVTRFDDGKSLDLRFHGCVYSPDAYRARDDLQSRLFFTLKGHAQFLRAAIAQCSECPVLGERLGQIVNSTRANSRDRIVPFSVMVSPFLLIPESYCPADSNWCLDAVLVSFQAEYGKTPFDLRKQFLAMDIPFILFDFPTDKILGLVMRARKNCLAGWKSTCRFLPMFNPSTFVTLVARSGTNFSLQNQGELQIDLMTCPFECSARREMYFQYSNVLSVTFFTHWLLHLMALFQYCPTAQCQADIMTMYMNVTDSMEVGSSFC
jgi:hypothetical protein